MKFKNDKIQIVDWHGNVIYVGPYDHEEVDEILASNKCMCHEGCEKCDGTGYMGDFEVFWDDPSDKENHNVYEYINY